MGHLTMIRHVLGMSLGGGFQQRVFRQRRQLFLGPFLIMKLDQERDVDRFPSRVLQKARGKQLQRLTPSNETTRKVVRINNS